MARPTGLRGIAHCYFSVHLRDGTRVFRWRRVVVFGIAPLVMGTLLAWRIGMPPVDKLSLVVAVLAVVAAVLIGLLPLAHSILGQTDSRRMYTEGERPLAQQDLDRVQTLQDLHASISWAVILLVGGLGLCAAAGLIVTGSSNPPPEWRQYVDLTLMAGLYSVMASTALTFFDVAEGVFEGMESHAESIKRRIRSNVKSGGAEERQDDSSPR